MIELVCIGALVVFYFPTLMFAEWLFAGHPSKKGRRGL